MAELKNAVLKLEGQTSQFNRMSVVLRITAEFLPVEDAAELPVPEEAEEIEDTWVGIPDEPASTDEERMAQLQQLIAVTRLYVDGLQAANLPAQVRAEVAESLAGLNRQTAILLAGVDAAYDAGREELAERYQVGYAEVAAALQSDKAKAFVEYLRTELEKRED